MKVKVGLNYYDGSDIPIMVILTDQDKKNIAMMPDWATKYAILPDHLTEDQVKSWMEGDNTVIWKVKEITNENDS